MIKFITDSTGYFSKDEIEEKNIGVVPLNYILGDNSGVEMLPGGFGEFFKILKTTNLFPTTSQPAIGDFKEEYEKAFSQGFDEIIVVVLSSKLSGTYNSANLAKNIMANDNIKIVDSLASAAGMKYLIREAYEMAKNGKSSDQIYNYLEKRKKDIKIYLTVESLEYLSRGGRMSSLQSKVGNLLNIKPIIGLKDGSLELLDKVRGKKRAMQTMIGLISDGTKFATVCHVINEKEAIDFKNAILSKFPDLEVSIEELGPVVGSHVGPGGIGICLG